MQEKGQKQICHFNPKYKTASFKVREFLCCLNDVYGAFNLFLIITGQKRYFDETRDITLSFKTGTNIELKEIRKDMTRDKCAELFERKYMETDFDNHISVFNDIHSSKKAKTLFDVAFYQLKLLIDEPERETGICEQCRQYFELREPRQKYCDRLDKHGWNTCSAKKAYKEKQKIKQREDKDI